MPPKILGGYILTYEQAAIGARAFGLSWNSNPKVYLGVRQAINSWMRKNAPGLWDHRLQPIQIEENGETVTKLIFPIVGNKDQQEEGFVYDDGEGTAPYRFREIAKRVGMSDELFVNFVTVRNPRISFLAPPGSRFRLHRR